MDPLDEIIAFSNVSSYCHKHGTSIPKTPTNELHITINVDKAKHFCWMYGVNPDLLIEVLCNMTKERLDVTIKKEDKPDPAIALENLIDAMKAYRDSI